MKKNTLISLIITFVVAVIAYYFLLPPFNVTSPLFWSYVLSMIFLLAALMFSSSFDFIRRKNNLQKSSIIIVFSICIIILLIVSTNFVLSPLFQSDDYANRITILEDGNFNEDIAEVNFNKLPLLDKDSSLKLGDRVMGQMSELVSQFYVSNLYTQINYNDSIIRVTPLEYNGIFKYFTNRSNGVKGYITVNSVSGESTLVKLDKGMRYMPSAYFFEDLNRHLRVKYPMEIFDEEYFELDNEGNPYWIVPTVSYKGIGIRKDITGVIIVNPINGECTKYEIEEIPSWVDHVYDPYLIIEQVDDWGSYKNGFFNSIFGQKNVVMTTEGYNYTIMNDDVYLYTGITSVVNDESNIGFILTNLRTKETVFYSVPGAEEYSAMASAEGQVQQMKYTSTFPLLINLNGRATYVVSLKDNAGLVKMYGFVDVLDYQKVSVSDSSLGIQEAARVYLEEENFSYEEATMLNKTITVQTIKSVVQNGNTTYYIVDTIGNKYKASIKVNDNLLPFVESGAILQIGYLKEEVVTEIINIY